MANNLKSLRNAKTWTREQAAKEFNLSPKGYEKIETGERGLGKKHLERAMAIYRVSAEAVMRKDAPFVMTAGRRLENIRKALLPDLPSRIGFSFADWTEVIRQNQVATEIAIKIHNATGLPTGYIMLADTTGMSAEILSKLLAAALDDPFGIEPPASDVQTQSSGASPAPAKEPATPHARSQAIAKRSARPSASKSRR